MPHDCTFTPSTFGGGWIKANTPVGAAFTADQLGPECQGDAPWPEGWIVEPFELERLAEFALLEGVVIVS